jgi:glucokinase
MKRYTIGFDVGGTRLKSGAVTREGALLAESITSSGANLGPVQLFETLRQEVDRIAGKLREKPQAIGLGMPGAVDPRQGVVLLPGKLKGLEGFPIVPKLEKATGIPIIADNDGRISIVAERSYGLARRRNWAVSITIGTGVGSGVLLDGQILRDSHLQFGTQLSHIVMQSAGGKLCLTGARGTAETLCSATALATEVRDGLQRGIISVLSDRYFADPHSIDFAAVLEGVQRKDRLCLDGLKRWTENLGWFLVSAVHVYAPEVIILSGGATNASLYFLKPLREHVNQHIFRYPVRQQVPILISKMRDHAGVLGAAALAWQHLEQAVQSSAFRRP